MSPKKVSKKRKKRRSTLGADKSQQSKPFYAARFFGYTKSGLKPFGICLGIIVLLVFAAHTITIWGEFVYLDLYNVADIRHTRDWGRFASDLLLYSLVNPLNEPLVRFTLTIDVLSMGIRSPGIFHAINMLMHLTNSVLIFLLVRRLTNYQEFREKSGINPDLIALASASIFACHPLACGAISYISARSALLVVLNYMISLHLFISGFLSKEIKDALYCYGFSYLFVIFAIWSGPQAITIPTAFIALAFLLKPKELTYKTWVMDRPFEFFAQILVAVAVPLVLLMNFTPLVGNGLGLPTLPMNEYIATQFKVLTTYTLRCFLAPYGLSLDPPMVLSGGFTDPFTIFGIILVLLVAFLAFKLHRKLMLSFALILFVLSLVPSCFVPQPEYVSITRIYLTMASLSMISGYFLGSIAAIKPTTTAVVSGVLALILIGLANYRNYEWQDDIRLWKSALNINPESKRSKAMYAWANMFHGQMDKGYKLAKEIYKNDENNVILNWTLGFYHLTDKEYKEAYKYYKKGVKLAENKRLSKEITYKLESGLAETALRVKDYKTALKYAEKAIRIQKSAKLYYIQGVCLLAEDNPHGAYMKLQESYLMDKYNPELIEPLTRAAIGCGTKQLQDIAYNMSKQAYRVHGSDPKMLLLRAYASLESGRVNEALVNLRKFLKSEKPTDESYYLLYGAYHKLGKEKEAQLFLNLALEANPRIRQEMRLYLNREIVKPKKKKLKKDTGAKDKKQETKEDHQLEKNLINKKPAPKNPPVKQSK